MKNISKTTQNSAVDTSEQALASARRMPPKIARPTPLVQVSSAVIDTIHKNLHHAKITTDEAAERLLAIAQQGSPLIESASSDDERIVTFLYHDRQAEQVLIFVNRLTDEKNIDDSLMKPIGKTGWFSKSFLMKTNWRASYCYIPAYAGQTPVWVTQGQQVRLRAALDSGYADVYNQHRCLNRAGKELSVVSLSEAPEQRYLPEMEQLRSLDKPKWVQAPEDRQILVHSLPHATKDSPIALVFDGEVWLSMGLQLMLESAFAEGALDPMHVVFVHSGGRERRWAELDGTAPMGQYLISSLIPWLEEQYGIGISRGSLMVMGQSLGGLSSLLLALDYPQEVGAVISQSASLWQPVVAESLQRIVSENEQERLSHLYFDIQVGAQEWVLEPPHQIFVRQLRQTPATVNFTVFNGGHDYACWRGDLIPAINRAQKYMARRKDHHDS
ncbi:alpha/beta hydrolase-fold protein [Rothia sp. CCM 9419]|uniref:alpha/beta hydrolase-fold protein n=1 Tax=Rothia sp. CCM 9419 TaxID=3402662 RepID=UPI003AE66250